MADTPVAAFADSAELTWSECEWQSRIVDLDLVGCELRRHVDVFLAQRLPVFGTAPIGSLNVLLALVEFAVCGLSTLAIAFALALAVVAEFDRRLVVVVWFDNEPSGAFASYVDGSRR
jgi:hypothetical protein